jgi:putative salt-induced outer membrane protein YdiY
MDAWIAIVACLLLADPPTHEITLASGETLRGMLVEQTAERVVFDHPNLGRLELSADSVKGVVALAQTPQPAQQPLAAAQPAADAQPAPPAAPPPPRWKSRFDVGFSGSAGVTEDTNLRLAFKTAHKTPEHHYRIDATYIWETSRGDRTENKFTSGVRADWPIGGSPWNWFLQARYDYDEFQSWDHRFSAHGGVGYHLVNIDHDDGSDKFDFLLRGGLGGRKEIGSIDEDFQPEALFGIDLDWHVSEKQEFHLGSTAYPDLDELGELRVITKAEYTIELDAMEGLVFAAGIDWEWQSQTDPGIKPNDFNAYLSLGMKF